MKPMNPEYYDIPSIILFNLSRRILESSTQNVTKLVKSFFSDQPDLNVRCMALSGQGILTWLGMLGYVQKASTGRDGVCACVCECGRQSCSRWRPHRE